MNASIIEFPLVVTSVIAIALGALVCLFGHRLFKFVLGLVGFMAGAIAAGGLAQLLTSGAQWVVLILGLVGGIIGSCILIWAFHVGVFLVGAVGGLVVGSVVATGLSGWLQTLVIIAVAVLGGILALRLQRVVIGVATAVIGAAMIVGAGLNVLVGPEAALEVVDQVTNGGTLEHVGWIAVGSWFVLSVLGAGVQLGRKAR